MVMLSAQLRALHNFIEFGERNDRNNILKKNTFIKIILGETSEVVFLTFFS
jgi:hypothetical protein